MLHSERFEISEMVRLFTKAKDHQIRCLTRQDCRHVTVTMPRNVSRCSRFMLQSAGGEIASQGATKRRRLLTRRTIIVMNKTIRLVEQHNSPLLGCFSARQKKTIIVYLPQQSVIEPSNTKGEDGVAPRSALAVRR